jgi:hypothetical protein
VDPRPPERIDTRFTTIDDAVTLLGLLPPVERIAWPEEPGDEQVIADALAWLTAWAPQANRAFKLHLRERRRAAANGASTGGPNGGP